MNLTGSVTSLPDSKGNVTVQMGILRSQVNISDLEIVEEKPSYSAKQMQKTGKGKLKMGKSLSVDVYKRQAIRCSSAKAFARGGIDMIYNQIHVPLC